MTRRMWRIGDILTGMLIIMMLIILIVFNVFMFWRQIG